MRALCICEKPSLMREIKSVYDKIGFKDKIDFIALHGHILTLKNPNDYDSKYESWDKSLLPIFPTKWEYKPVDKELVNKVRDALKNNNYDYIINATDAEREGQNIFYSVYMHLGCKLPVKRIWLNDLNFAPIKYAIENMREDQKEPFLRNLTAAALARAKADWLVGMNFSRATSIRIGRVKTPTLELLYKRELEIQNFKPETHYVTGGDFGFPTENEEEFDTLEKCQKFIDGLSDTGTIKSFESKPTKWYAPLLFSLGELQSEANKVYGMTLQETLDTAQSLYEKKITTYPRTDCSYLPSGDAKKVNGYVDMLIDIVGGSPKLITKTLPKRYVDDSKVQAHGAIIFTGTKFEMNKLSDFEKNIVTLVAKRILATFMNPIETIKTKVEIDVDGNLFVGNGSVNTNPGWGEIYGRKINDVVIPNLRVGNTIKVKKYEPLERTSKCPPRYNDGTLIKAMINIGNTLEDEDEKAILKGVGDQGGIGTPATRANIVESLLEKPSKNSDPWVERKGKSFYVTGSGMTVGAALKDYSFASASLTAKWETKLNEIVDGKIAYTEFLDELNKYVRDETKMLIEKEIKLPKSSLKAVCPVCGGPITVGKNYYYCGKKDGDNVIYDFIIGKTYAGAKITDKDVENICSGKKTRPLQMTSKAGKQFKGMLFWNKEENKIGMEFANSFSSNKEGLFKCHCGGDVIKLNGKYGAFYKCQSCETMVPETYCGKKFSSNNVKDIYNGKKVNGKFKSKAGKDFEAKAYLENNKLTFEFAKYPKLVN